MSAVNAAPTVDAHPDTRPDSESINPAVEWAPAVTILGTQDENTPERGNDRDVEVTPPTDSEPITTVLGTGTQDKKLVLNDLPIDAGLNADAGRDAGPSPPTDSEPAVSTLWTQDEKAQERLHDPPMDAGFNGDLGRNVEDTPPVTDSKLSVGPKPPLPPRPTSTRAIAPSPVHARAPSDDSSDEATHQEETAQPVDPNLPEATHPTVALAIPFPTILHPEGLTEKQKAQIPPFVLYAPLAAPFKKPAEGEKEGLARKAQRKWQEEEAGARGKTGFKAKAVGLISKGMAATKNSRIEFLVRTPNKKKLKELRIIYPSNYQAEDMKALFTDMIKKAKSGAIKNGIVSTAMLPFVLAFDVFTFVSGPFEINAVWAASSWTGAAQASSISNRITSSSLPVSLSPSPLLNPLQFRLHEVCWRKARPGTVPSPPKIGGEVPKRGPDLARVVLEAMEAGGEDMEGCERDRILVGEDLERCLRKGAKEWAKAVNVSK